MFKFDDDVTHLFYPALWCSEAAHSAGAARKRALRRSALRAPFLKILMKASIWTRVSAEGERSPIGDGSSYTSQQKRYYVFNTQSSSKTGPASLSGASLREAQALSHIHKGSADAAATIQKPPSSKTGASMYYIFVKNLLSVPQRGCFALHPCFDSKIVASSHSNIRGRPDRRRPPALGSKP